MSTSSIHTLYYICVPHKGEVSVNRHQKYQTSRGPPVTPSWDVGLLMPSCHAQAEDATGAWQLRPKMRGGAEMRHATNPPSPWDGCGSSHRSRWLLTFRDRILLLLGWVSRARCSFAPSQGEHRVTRYSGEDTFSGEIYKKTLTQIWNL